ncbi:helix-turn-helix domain-containing protein [Apilactobacillus sp. TMW 2.2459]|uniref:helix-turn-helix domain-containing protein n=1 Tax=Apilactobacillus xinyiensis TaxID=2841032 RepID=UPI001C7DD2C4|nr:helix-turn-helix transcriptional regulator [Apilactobacillus xinyiensis]MCL0312563.1 helix-turn-helix domain-containing protein [Apilactobacillus xinyiensis]
MRFGDRLRNERKLKNVNQSEVAEYLHVSRNTISNWENERSYPDIESLIKLSDYYKVSLDVLLKEDKGMKEYLGKKEFIENIKMIECFVNIAFIVCMFFWIVIKPSNTYIFITFIFISIICEIASVLINKCREKVQNTEVYNFALTSGLPLIFIVSGVRFLLNPNNAHNFGKLSIALISICFLIFSLVFYNVSYVLKYLKNKK